jgi:hypothetical protein|tara:strand:+ start:253 stop:438 length:186 start_codon:yes stop_codon:yes gene_type:complete
MKEWIEDATEWVKDRVQERTTWDGVMLIAVGLVGLLFQGLVTWAAYIAIAYGVWTLVKSEW